MVGIAQHESGLNTEARHLNPNGTWDYGLAQINSSNLPWLGLTPVTVMGPCRNLAAGARVLLAKYNGAPPDVAKAAYSNDVMAKVADLSGQLTSAPQPAPADDPDDPRPPAWVGGRLRDPIPDQAATTDAEPAACPRSLTPRSARPWR